VSRFDLVIFDCDGVLVDSERLAIRVEGEILASIGWPMSSDEIVERFVGRSVAHMKSEVEAHIGREIDWDNEFDRHYREVFETELTAIEGVRDVLESLESPFCVASSGTVAKVTHSLHLTGLFEFFEGRIFGADLVRNAKPAPDLFLLAAREMDADPVRCCVIEDSLAGVNAAQAARMDVFAFAGGVTPATTLAGAGVRLFTRMSELATLLAS